MTGTPLGSEFSAGTSSAGRLKPDTLLTAFGTVNHRLHHQRRAAIGTFFSKRAMTDVEPLIHANVKTLCDTIRRQQERDGHVELRVNFLAMTTDTIANHSLNGSNPQNTISLLENEERAAEWKRTIAALAMLTPIVKQATWLIPVALKVPVAIWMMTIPSLGRIVRLNRDMHRSAQSYIDQTIHDSKKTESTIESIAEYHNIFRTILQSSLPPQEKTPERLGQEGFVSIAAGGETCGRMLTNAIYYIIANKDRVMPSLAHELAAVMPNPDVQPELQALEQLPYLTGVIRETLRLSAILTSRLPLVAPDRTLRYKDSVIPPGHPVSMSLRDILHDPSIFRDPLAFRPERWLRSNPDYELVNRFYVPFSRGTRMCIGINHRFSWEKKADIVFSLGGDSIAYAQLYIVLACVLRRFEVSDFDVVYERDIKAARDCFIGEPSLESLGVRVKMEPVLAGQTRLAG
ncbi:MAG: hypothetical protein LQ342_006642 [Letrouitia transgressa]|nr:MAG: hypothetical protein LQ342_006642 [Letrouitia transgressa]